MLNRYEELDSLRGLAALTVVFNHFLNVVPMVYFPEYYPDNVFIKILKFTPVHLFWAGHEAVILFFVLSGFVLALPFLQNRQVSYSSFLVKRFFRIYIPYICTLVVAITLNKTISRNGIPELGMWFNFAWTEKVTWHQVIDHVILLGDFKNYIFDPVIWSLIHELRISLIFPLVMFIIIKWDCKKNLGLAIFLSVVSYYIKKIMLNQYNYIDYSSSYIDTIHYLSLFIIGALLAKYKDKLKDLLIANSGVNLFIFLAAILFYTYPWWFFINDLRLHNYIINDWMTAIGVSIFIILALSSRWISRILNLGILRFLGKISYSLYLYHSIVLLSFVNILFGVLPLRYILLMALLSSFILATFAFYCIEKPSIQIGRKVARKF